MLRLLQRCAESANRALGLEVLLAAQQRRGIAEVEAVHMSCSDSLQRLQGAFGKVLRQRVREATFYTDLVELKLDLSALSRSLMGG
jgi:hypothetical protein